MTSGAPTPPAPSLRLLMQAALAVAAVVALALLLVRREPSPGIEVERRAPAPGIDEIRVDVSGAVRAPGVVVARPGQRVQDAIAAAGGAAPEADLGALTSLAASSTRTGSWYRGPATRSRDCST